MYKLVYTVNSFFINFTKCSFAGQKASDNSEIKFSIEWSSFNCCQEFFIKSLHVHIHKEKYFELSRILTEKYADLKKKH